MTVITRHDQTQFVLDVYREQVTVTKRSQLSRLLRDWQTRFGGYAHCSLVTDQRYEIVLAAQPGYLLAETIRHYFHTNHNLIFCEWAAEHSMLIVVVIQAGVIYLDRTLDPSCLTDELLPLRLGKHDYQLVVAGHGISANAPPDWVHAFTALCSRQEFLSHSVIAHLPTLEQALLSPTQQLIKKLAWRSHAPLWLGSAVIAALVMAIGLFTTRERQQSPAPIVNSTPASPWPSYQAAMREHASASQLLSTTTHLLQTLRGLAGWTLLRLQLEPAGLTALLQATDGNLSALQALAQQTGAQVHTTADGTLFTQNFHVAQATTLPALSSLSATQAILQESLLRYTVDSQIQQLGTRTYADCQAVRLSVTLHDLYLAELTNLAHLFQDQPITLEQIEVSVHDWQMHAVIKLSVWGIV